jgi:hypothetical protein
MYYPLLTIFVPQVVDDGEGVECPILCYYESPSDTNPLGQIDLRNTETNNSRDPAMLSKHPHSFEIAHRGMEGNNKQWQYGW